MTHLEHQVLGTIGSKASMARLWKACADAVGPPVEFMGLSIDYQQNGFVQIPTVYVLLAECEDAAAEELRLRPFVDATIADVRSRFYSLQREDLYCDKDNSVGRIENIEHFAIKLYTERGLREIKAADEREAFRKSPGKNVAARHPAELSGIDDYSPIEFHIFFHTDAIWRANPGLGAVIEKELIEYCHEIGRTDRTLENTKFVFTTDEELKRDYIGFYK